MMVRILIIIGCLWAGQSTTPTTTYSALSTSAYCTTGGEDIWDATSPDADSSGSTVMETVRLYTTIRGSVEVVCGWRELTYPADWWTNLGGMPFLEKRWRDILREHWSRGCLGLVGDCQSSTDAYMMSSRVVGTHGYRGHCNDPNLYTWYFINQNHYIKLREHA